MRPVILWGRYPEVELLGHMVVLFLSFYLFMYLFLAVLGLRGRTRAFSSCGGRASRCGGFSCGAWALVRGGSVFPADRPRSCGPRA